MEWVFVLLIVLLFGAVIAQTVRANRAFNADWRIRTSLSEASLRSLITKALKGMNPMAVVGESRPGVISRSVERGNLARNMYNRATCQVSIGNAPDGGGARVVHAEIVDWQSTGPRILLAFGLRPYTAVFAGRRRISSVMAKIQEADPGATVL